MSAWQGGYEPRRKPAVKRVCPDCYSTYYNEPAHLEACPGPRRFPRLCATRQWQQGNTYLTCQKQAGHEGEHAFR